MSGVPLMAKLLGTEPKHEELHALWLTSPSVVAHETGKIDAETFAAGVVSDLNLPVSSEHFLQNFSDWPNELLRGAIEVLKEIPDSYLVAALSNTSAIHWDKIQVMGLADHFHQTFLSHKIGFLKPDEQAFHTAIEGMELPPSEILFFDDGMRNIDAAGKLGMNAHLVKNPDEVRGVLKEYDVL